VKKTIQGTPQEENESDDANQKEEISFCSNSLMGDKFTITKFDSVHG